MNFYQTLGADITSIIVVYSRLVLAVDTCCWQIHKVQFMSKNGKWLISIVLGLGLLMAQQGGLDQSGARGVESGLGRAMITFGLARTLNGVISVAQGTEVAVEPVGIGLTLKPGELLDPVNDLIERFSWVMLLSSTSFGIQAVLLEITRWSTFTLLIALAVGFSLLFLWRSSSISWGLSVAIKLSFMLLVARLMVPVVTIAGEGVFELFLQPRYEAAQEHLQQTAEKLGELNEESEQAVGEDSSGFMGSVRQLYDTAADSINVKSRVDQFTALAAAMTRHTVELIVVFLMQTLLLPLFLIWLMLRSMRWIAKAPLREISQRQRSD